MIVKATPTRASPEAHTIVSVDTPPSFDVLLDLARIRLRDADALDASGIHSFKELMSDYAEVIPDNWYWEAFEELEAQGHLDHVSHKEFGGDARGRLSADGRFYLRSMEP